MPSVFENAVAFRVFTFTFRFDMPQRAPFGEMRHPSVKEAEAPGVPWWDTITTIPPNTAILPNSSSTLHNISLCSYAPDGSEWVHKCRYSCFSLN